MSRQRAGWGYTRFADKFEQTFRKKSLTAGVNKYDPRTASREGEMERRRVQLQKLKEKADKKRGG